MEEDETKPVMLSSTKAPGDHDGNAYTNITNKNGLTSIELLMSMTGDLNRNLPMSGLANVPRPSADDGQDMNCMRGLNTDRNHHASQLLKAAASVVSNGLHPFYQQDSHSSLPTSSLNEVEEKPAITNSSALSNSTTVVSFSSKPTMSTGFPSTALMQPKFSDTRIFESARSSATEFPRTSQPSYNVPSVVKNSTMAVLPNSLQSKSTIVVPLLWRRVFKDGVILYYSPSGDELGTLEDLKKYLLSEETCKCGLVCPFHVEKVFNFDPMVESQDWKLSDLGINSETSVRSCCHRKHVRSTALAKDCKTLPKPSKPSPARRRVKPTQKTGVRKSAAGMSQKDSKQKYSRLEEGDSLRSQTMVTSSSSNTTPIPPIETVMRGSMYTPHNEHTGLQSPRQLSETASPSMSMLSVHSAPNQSGHMLPGMGPSGYPSPHAGTFVPPMYRHAVETEMMSPGNHPIYLPGMQGIPHPHAPMPPYHNPSGYEYMQSQQRSWNSSIPPVHTMPPPPGVQFGPPAVWPARPETNNSRKRRRRTSSISSNGGNSDTGYTSGLSSPAHTSPGQNKLHEKADSALAKSKIVEDRKHPITESGTATKEPNGITNRQNKPAETKSANQAAGTQETGAMRHTSVIRSPEMRVPHSHTPAHIPAPPYVPPGQRLPKHSTTTSYQPSHQPLPPIQLSERPPTSTYGQQHSRAQVIKGVYSRPSNDSRPSDLAIASTDEGSSDMRSSTLTKSSASTADTVTNSETEPQDLTISNGVGSRRMSESALLSQHTGIIPQSTHFVPPPMYMNGFQPNPHMVPPMHYPSSGMPDEYGYPARPPVQMMRAPNGQLFYRYAQPRMPMTAQGMPYAVDNSMYSQMPFMPGQGASYGYPPPANPPASPKRKRKKTGTKTIIESHSAVLARTDNGPDGTEASKSAEHDSAASKPV